jgi:hypothetical protein
MILSGYALWLCRGHGYIGVRPRIVRYPYTWGPERRQSGLFLEEQDGQ